MLKETPSKKIVKTKSAPRLALAIGMVLIGVGLIVSGLRGVLGDRVYIRTPKMLIRAEVADDETERILGLSGRDALDENRALLFMFDEPGIHGIWMKDMKFAVDIVWLDGNKKVLKIEEKVKPSSYPEIYEPSVRSLYVIEFAAGQTSILGVKINQTLSW